MVDYPVVYGPNAVPVQFICLVDAEGDPTVVSFITGPVTQADGANVALGHTTDAAATPTVIGLLKQLSAQWAAGIQQSISVNLTATGVATETTLENVLSALSLVTTKTAKVTPKGYVHLLNSDIVGGYTLNPPAGATSAKIRPEGGKGIRSRDDGVAPTSTVGMPLFSGETLSLNLVDMSQMKIIAMDSSTTLNIAYYA
jgi:hypothetical protein